MARRFENTSKRDPYRNFNFRIRIGGEEVAACRKMSPLTGSVEAIKFRAGNSETSVDECLPGRVSYEPVTLESGLTDDETFKEWADALIIGVGRETERREIEPNFRKEVEIDVFDLDNNQAVKRYRLYNAWVSKYTALSELAGEANEVLIESIEIQHEGYVIESVG